MARFRSLLGLSAVFMVACVFPTMAAPGSGSSKPNVNECQLSAADQAWIDQALDARRFMSRQIRGARLNSAANLIIFDDKCAITGTGAFSDRPVAWTSARHSGTVALPSGREQPADVTSFAGESGGQAYFVMSAPSVWQAKRVPGGPMGLEKLMTGVFLHESAHVAQYSTYMHRVGQIAERENLPESFGDDSIQERFRDNPDFAASVAQETDLLYAAAVASQDA